MIEEEKEENCKYFAKTWGHYGLNAGQFVYFVNILSPLCLLHWGDTKSETVTILDNKQNLKIFLYPALACGGEPAILHRNPDQSLDCPADNIVRKLTLIDRKTS